MLRCFKSCKGSVSEHDDFGRRKMIYNCRDWNVQYGMLRWQHAWRLRRDHRLAAIVGPVRRIAWHRTAALHGLLVGGHRGEAIRKLQH